MVQVGLVEDFRDGRWYERPTTSERLEAVSAIIRDCTNKDYLTAWGGKTSAIVSVDHIEMIPQMLAELGREATIAAISKAAEEKRNYARDRGSRVHAVIEALLTKSQYPQFPGLSDEEKAEVDDVAMGFLNFVIDYDATLLDDGDGLIMSEATVADPALGVAGTLDFGLWLAKLDGGVRVMVDAKSGSKIDPEVRAQLGAYFNMTEAWLPTGLIVPMPHFDQAAVLHLSREHKGGYKLRGLEADDLKSGYEWFLAMKEQHRLASKNRKVGGRVIYPQLPDGSQPLPDLEDIDINGWGRACGALRRAGFVNLRDLIGISSVKLQLKDGVGPETVKTVKAMLDHYGVIG